MMVTVQTTISYDPIKEQKAIVDFENRNDMTEWKKHTTTTNIVFVKTERFISQGKEAQNE